MTNMIWAFATVHWRDERFLTQFCKAGCHDACKLWGFSDGAALCMTESVEEVELKAEQYSPQDVGNTLWALATLSWRNDAALASISKRCFDTAVTFDQQNLSISLWSYATLGYKTMSPALFEQALWWMLIRHAFDANSRVFVPAVCLRNLFHHMTQLITERITTFASQGIANVVWALAKFQFQQKCLLMTIAEEAPPRLDEFDPQHLSILAWAYATLEFPNRPLLTALCQAAVRKMDIFNAQHMANMTWAMATLAHKDDLVQADQVRTSEDAFLSPGRALPASSGRQSNGAGCKLQSSGVL